MLTGHTLAALLKKAVFAPCVSCLHAAGIVRLVKALPVNRYSEAFGEDGLLRVTGVLVGLCWSSSKKVWTKARNMLATVAQGENIHCVIERVRERMDYFDAVSLTRALSALALIAERNSSSQTQHLRRIAIETAEMCQLYSDDLLVLTSVFEFLARVDLSFAGRWLGPCRDQALCLVAAELMELTEKVWTSATAKVRVMLAIVDNDMKSRDSGVIGGDALGYDQYFRPLAQRCLSWRLSRTRCWSVIR